MHPDGCVILDKFYVINPTKATVISGKIEESLKHTENTEFQVMPVLVGNMVSTVPSKFAYLVQMESCLPDNLKSVEVFGNALACQCDVFVLSTSSTHPLLGHQEGTCSLTL